MRCLIHSWGKTECNRCGRKRGRRHGGVRLMTSKEMNEAEERYQDGTSRYGGRQVVIVRKKNWRNRKAV